MSKEISKDTINKFEQDLTNHPAYKVASRAAQD